MDDEYFEHAFYYDDRYYTFSELYEMYKKLANEQKKLFKDAIAHFTLAEILRKCFYDKRYIKCVEELSHKESSRISLYGADCGRVLLGIKKMYDMELRELLNVTGKLAVKDDNRINLFINGEELLNNIVGSTLGTYEKDELNDFSLIKYQQLSDEECLAISDNFVRYMKGEKLTLYNEQKKLKK